MNKIYDLKLINHKFKPMSKIHTFKNITFKTPISGLDKLIRSEVLCDHNMSFFHAVLCTQLKEYINMDEQSKNKMALKLKNQAVDKPSFESWKTHSNTSEVIFNIKKLLKMFWKYLTETNPTQDDKHLNIIINNILTSEKDRKIYIFIIDSFPDIFDMNEFKNNDIQTYINNIVCRYKNILQNLTNGTDSQRSLYIINKLERLLINVSTEAERIAYENYKFSDIRVDTDLINSVSNIYKTDIFIFSSKDNMPYKCNNVKYRQTILFQNNNGRYDVIGRLLVKNHVQRIFNSDDTLIKRIKVFLLEPTKVPIQYPDLEVYLPVSVNYKKQSPIKHDGSEFSDSDRSPSYKSEDEFVHKV